MALTDIWRDSPYQLEDKQVHQIIAFAGKGKLLDGSLASNEFREFLSLIPTRLLAQYAIECLNNKFEGSGLALQDVMNQVGRRLGFIVVDGRYRGGTGHIGFDGLWQSPEGHAIIAEVKTTDAYRLDLEVVAQYRRTLINNGKVGEGHSSMLMIVGREDTGGLEAQIRGSRYAWDIRLISVDALLRLLTLKEEIDKPGTIERIRQILIPREFTKVDGIIDLVFSATEDIQIESLEPEEQELTDKSESIAIPSVAPSNSNFYDEIVKRVESRLNMVLVKQSRTTYKSPDGTTTLICAVSKEYVKGGTRSYWFGFHSYHRESLSASAHGYVALGCASPDTIIMVPFDTFTQWLEGMNTTSSPGRFYWHISVFLDDKGLTLHRKNGVSQIDLNRFLLP